MANANVASANAWLADVIGLDGKTTSMLHAAHVAGNKRRMRGEPMSVLTKEQYAEVQREIESRAIHYHGQIGADVDWLLTQVRFYRLQVDVLTADVAKLREALVAVVDADHDTDNDGVHYVDFKKNWPPCEACKAIERARDVLAATAPKEPPCP